MQFREAVRNFLKQNRRQVLTAAAAVFVVCALFMTGVFSYFHGSDVVANRLTAPQGSVALNEPKWDSTGQYMAANAEPGMEIPKDPSGWNNGSVDVYIRLKMTVETIKKTDYENACTLPEANQVDTAAGEIGKKTEAERLTAIVNAIQYVNDSDVATQFLTLNTSQAIEACANGKFYFDPENKSTDSNQLTYYFYYTAGDTDSTGADLMHRVAPNCSTDELFQRVDIPKYKKDYLGVFDFDFSITLTAEAIPVGNDDTMTVSDAIGKFD